MRLPRHGGGILLLTPFFVIPGCHDPVANLDTDGAFIRRPGDPPQGVNMRTGPLIPPIQGTSYTMELRTTQKTQKPVLEQIVVSSVVKTGEQTRITLETRQNGKPTRREAYLSDAEGLKMTAAGLADSVSLTPPLPLVRYPLRDGDLITWTGVLKFRGISAPGTAYSRVSGQASVPTGVGELGTYRVDTLIETTVQGRQVPFLTWRWFAPGVGIARQWNFGNGGVTQRTLLRRRAP